MQSSSAPSVSRPADSSDSADISVPKSRNYYLVRSSRSIPPESGLVGVGWDDMPFVDFPNADDLINHMLSAGWDLGRSANQIRRFKGIRKGDLIVVPMWGAVAIGEATGEEVHDNNEPYYSSDGSNQHRVNFPRDAAGKVRLIARSELREDLQRRLKIRLTIADLWEFADLLEGSYADLVAGRAHSRPSQVEAEEARQIQSMKTTLLHNIQSGKTSLASGGIGLEHLVRELLEIDGFEATVLGKAHFGSSHADADISAIKTHSLGTQQYLIQVKHHGGESGSWGLDQLIAIPEQFPSEYGDHELVLVTSGTLSSANQELAQKHGIIVRDGPGLVDWIFASLPKLSRETQIALGIMNVPTLYAS